MVTAAEKETNLLAQSAAADLAVFLRSRHGAFLAQERNRQKLVQLAVDAFREQLMSSLDEVGR